MNELTKVYKHFALYFSAVTLLFVARKISMNGFNDECMDILRIIPECNFNQCYSVLSSSTTVLNTPELVKLLQRSAIEHLTKYRQLTAPDFASAATIVTTDFEALYAYKRGDYQRCLQLSTQNVHTLWNTVDLSRVPIWPEFIQLLDDDIVSLTALLGLFVVNPEWHSTNYTCISQLTLSLYLMTQCQLKLHHSVTSLAQTLEYIKVAQRGHPRILTLDHLTLKLIERKTIRAILLNY